MRKEQEYQAMLNEELKEYLKDTQRSVTLNVTAGKIQSFRELEKTTGTVRVYDNGCIGVAGCLGEPDINELTEKAKEWIAAHREKPCYYAKIPVQTSGAFLMK